MRLAKVGQDINLIRIILFKYHQWTGTGRDVVGYHRRLLGEAGTKLMGESAKRIQNAKVFLQQWVDGPG